MSQGHWETLSREEAQFYLALGDNVYADKRIVADELVRFESSLAQLEEAYAIQAQHPEFQDFLKGLQVIPTWDDHDYGLNDAGQELPFAKGAQRAFLEFWKIPEADPRWKRDGVYASQLLRLESYTLQIITLDTRFFRSALLALEVPESAPYGRDDSAEKSILGDEQWAWLEAELSQPADLRVVLSSVQLLSDSHGYERWGTFPHERERLMGMLQAAGSSLVVSGDRHLGAIYHDPSHPQLWELTTSSLNTPFGGAKEEDPLRVGDFTSAANFGRIELAQNQLRFELVAMSGDVIASQQMTLPRASNP